jgi:hypothetical protein
MKQNLSVRFIVLGLAAIFYSGAYSQLSAAPVARIDKHAQSVGKSFTAAGVDADKLALASLKAVNSKMFNHFSKNFKNASDIRISSVGKFTDVDFSLNGIANKVQYDRKGRWMYSISHYEEAKLSDELRDRIEQAFPGYSVFGFVTEVKVLDKSATLVMIENRKSWKRVRIMDGDIEIYEEYTKP